jgi:hypothetical protein
MFYEVLMEKKAETAEAKGEKKRKGLSTGQKIGVGAAGALVGAPLGAYGAIRPALTNKRYMNFLGNKAAFDQVNTGTIDEASSRLAKATKGAKRRTIGALGAGALVGAGATAYGAKKLFDVYNRRKQQREE